MGKWQRQGSSPVDQGYSPQDIRIITRVHCAFCSLRCGLGEIHAHLTWYCILDAGVTESFNTLKLRYHICEVDVAI